LAEAREACDERSFEVPHSSQNLPFVGSGLLARLLLISPRAS